MDILGYVNHNRFLLLDLRSSPGISSKVLAKISSKLCSTLLIDDLIVLEESTKAEARMRIFGGDAREADFCGNGALFSLHILFKVLQRNNRDLHEMILETNSGLKEGILEKNGRVSVDIGSVTNCDLEIGTKASKQIEKWGVKLEGFRIAGEPHIIVSLPSNSPYIGQSRFQLEVLAENLVKNINYDGGVNLTMILDPLSEDVEIRTFERGVKRMTESCGSGAVAAASVLFDQRPSRRKFKISSPGGMHFVKTDPQGQRWWLSGQVFHFRRGQILDLSV